MILLFGLLQLAALAARIYEKGSCVLHMFLKGGCCKGGSWPANACSEASLPLFYTHLSPSCQPKSHEGEMCHKDEPWQNRKKKDHLSLLLRRQLRHMQISLLLSAVSDCLGSWTSILPKQSLGTMAIRI